MDPKVLEDAIYAAVKRIDEDREARALEQYKKDDLNKGLQEYLKVLFFSFFLMGIFSCLAFILSCFPISWQPLHSLSSFSQGWKIAIAVASAFAAAFSFHFQSQSAKKKTGTS